MAGSVVTVLQEVGGKPINKEVKRNPDGSITKGMAINSGCYRAETIAAPDLETFADMIFDLSNSPDKTLMLGTFKGAPDYQQFLVLPEELVIKHLKLDPAYPDIRKAVLGFHDHPHQHMQMVARLKDNCEFSNWLLFDRDAVDGMPDELANLSREEWLDAMNALLPGFKNCRRLTLPSTSSRIIVDGKRLESSSYHVFVQVADPHEIPRVWGQLLPKAMVTPSPAYLDRGCMPLGFLRPKYSRADRSQIVAHQPWSIFDPSTGQTNRLVFDGSPVVRGDGLAVADADYELHDGPPLDLSAFEDLTTDEIREVETIAKVKVSLERSTNGSGIRVTGVSSTSPTLNLSLEVETKDYGWQTIQQLQDRQAGHARCQSPFRESTSWAAYYHTNHDGEPFVYDTGTNTKYVLPDEITGDALYDLSHDGLALHMGRKWVRGARHVALWGRWLFWFGDRWLQDEKLLHMTLARNYLRKRADEMVRDAKSGKFLPQIEDRDRALEIAEAQAKLLRMEPTRNSVVSTARSNHELVSGVEEWDGDIRLIGTPKGKQ